VQTDETDDEMGTFTNGNRGGKHKFNSTEYLVNTEPYCEIYAYPLVVMNSVNVKKLILYYNTFGAGVNIFKGPFF
jgi:hypothetical protein